MTFLQRHQLETLNAKTHIIVWGILLAGIVLFAALFYAFRDVNVWASLEASNGFKNPSYTERIFESSIFRTRANTWSNYAMVIVGVYVLAFAWHDWKRKMHDQSPSQATGGYLVNNPLFSLLFGVGCIYLGLASGFFHASLTRWGQQLDVASMYSAMTAVIAMNLCRFLPYFPGTTFRTNTFFVLLALIANYLLYYYKWQMSSQNVLSSLILTIVFLMICDLFRRNSKFAHLWSVGAFLSLTLAVVCRQLDVAGKFLTPDTIFQGHAFWHILCASTLACLYMYYRSEININTELTSAQNKL